MKKVIYGIVCLLILPIATLTPQTIEEKKASLLGKGGSDLDESSQALLVKTNSELKALKAHLKELMSKVSLLHKEGSDSEHYHQSIAEIKETRRQVRALEEEWLKLSSRNNGTDDQYALWHHPGTNIEQLVTDFGSQDYVYIIPDDIGAMKVSVASGIPVPRQSWEKILSLILSQNGVGVRQLTPVLRELYLINQDHSRLETITNDPAELEILSDEKMICYVMTPESTDVRGVYHMLEKFIRKSNTTLNLIGSDIFVIAQVGEIKELMKIYHFMESSRQDKEYKLVALNRGEPDEMANVLRAIFTEREVSSTASGTPLSSIASLSKNGVKAQKRSSVMKPTGSDMAESGLLVMPMKEIGPAIFLLGSQHQVHAAEEILFDLQNQIGETRDKTIFWYTAKHSDPEELATTLESVYSLMIQADIGSKTSEDPSKPPAPKNEQTPPKQGPLDVYQDARSIIVNPGQVDPSKKKEQSKGSGHENFIVDPKTGSVIMVVEPYTLPRLKELIKKLDVPKKMVKIEVLLFEKKITDQNNFGLNLLKLGGSAEQKTFNGATWNTGGNDGILTYLLSRGPSSPIGGSIDLAYTFLLSHEDVQINASPSVTTINQTTATIALVDEISINTGTVELDPERSSALKDSFVRAQYGIKIDVTPTIHEYTPLDDNVIDPFTSYITLETDITFDTPSSSDNDRPNVTRRAIKNEVLVADGESVILGGLRRKQMEDAKKSIPFLGELPGVGRLFSTTQLKDSTTEMFIFLTPRIIRDPKDDVNRIKCEESRRRPGDVPEFIMCLEQARAHERKKFLEGSMKMLLGRPQPSYHVFDIGGEYDGWEG